jgi:hypothetical protein
MKNLILSLALVACLAAGANAHSGMLVLFSDTNNYECYANIGAFQTGNLYLMYDRGDGPRMGNAYEFKLLKSTPNAVFLPPIWPSSIIIPVILGNIETGISLVAPDCFPDQAYVSLGTIPVMNIADPDTFTVKVVPDPTTQPQAILIVKCDARRSTYVLSGGTFVFNAGCASPQDPFGVVAAKKTTWGTIKELYR